jgi:hypothetical protein
MLDVHINMGSAVGLEIYPRWDPQGYLPFGILPKHEAEPFWDSHNLLVPSMTIAGIGVSGPTRRCHGRQGLRV